MAPDTYTVAVPSADLMRQFGASLAELLEAGDVVALSGDLGAGKTCLVQGIARGLDVPVSVTSPTFVLMRQYAGRIPLVHVDVYRLSALSDVNDLGDEVLAPDCVTAIEWADVIRPVLGDTYLDVEIALTPTDADVELRTVQLRAVGDRWAARGAALQRAAAAFERRLGVNPC